MAMSNAVDYLFEYVFCVIFRQMFALFDKLVQIASSSIFHDHHDVFFVFKYLIEPYDIWMPDCL